jgi:plastocyanin
MGPVWQAVQDAWNSILDLLTKIVTPDWGALIALIPIAVAIGVLVFFAWIVVRYANAGPKRRGPGRVTPKAPASVHMPGPSFAPLFAAVGAFLTFLGLVLGGIALWLGIAALVLTLLYWLREAMRDYDAVDHPETAVSTTVSRRPPPGIHMPGPSFRPLLVSIAAAVLFLGLVIGPALLVAGAIMLVVALLGWLGDAGREYEATAEADESGHPTAEPAPRYPIGTLITFVVVLIVGISVTAGVIPPTSGEGGAGASPSPGTSAGAGGAPVASGSPAPGTSAAPGGSEVPAADITVKAQNIAYDVTDISASAGKPFTIAFVNEDAGVPHNIAIKDASGADVFKGEIITGVATKVYQVPALQAGTYPFVCSVHPNMTGTLTVK